LSPRFNLWNYFFRAWLQQGPGVETVALGNVDIFVRFGHGVDPYFHLPTFDPLEGWQNVWFFLRNDTDVALLVFMGSRPILQPNWGYNVVKRDLRRLQPLHEVIQ
jgi:hypothetical protein